MKLDISLYHFEELLKKSISIDSIFLLQAIYEQIDVTQSCKESERISALYSGLKRKGFINDKGDITIYGKELLLFLKTKEKKKAPKRVSVDAEFDEWWKNFPTRDIFVHKGKSFTGCRTLRVDETKCRLEFDKIVSEGKYTAKQIIAATQADIMAKKDESVRVHANKLTYLQNSLTYLNQRTFAAVIDDSLSYESFTQINTGGTDI